jgi:hypothetical protein
VFLNSKLLSKNNQHVLPLMQAAQASLLTNLVSTIQKDVEQTLTTLSPLSDMEVKAEKDISSLETPGDQVGVKKDTSESPLM